MIRVLVVIFTVALLAGPVLPSQAPQYKEPAEHLPRKVEPQPVPFSHKAHVGAGSECVDCHVSVEKAARAGLPQADRCMLCHQTIKADSPTIRELARIRDAGREIDWVRVYKVPGYVWFNHANHRKAGIECATCHGPVAERDVLEQEVSVGMTSCMNCHAKRKVSNECHFCHTLGY